MATKRAIVCVGVPANLEVIEFEYKNGDRKGETGHKLEFNLDNPATQLVGSLRFETNSDQTQAAVQAAFDEARKIEVVASPTVIRSEKTNDYGRPLDWVKMTARAVL